MTFFLNPGFRVMNNGLDNHDKNVGRPHNKLHQNGHGHPPGLLTSSSHKVSPRPRPPAQGFMGSGHKRPSPEPGAPLPASAASSARREDGPSSKNGGDERNDGHSLVKGSSPQTQTSVKGTSQTESQQNVVPVSTSTITGQQQQSPHHPQRRRPPLPNFLPVVSDREQQPCQQHHSQNIRNNCPHPPQRPGGHATRRQVSSPPSNKRLSLTGTPVNLQALLQVLTASQVTSPPSSSSRKKFFHNNKSNNFSSNNAGLAFFPTSPSLRRALMLGATAAASEEEELREQGAGDSFSGSGSGVAGIRTPPTLKSPLEEILTYAAASLKSAARGSSGGALQDELVALEDALGFLRAFSDNACAASSSAENTENSTSSAEVPQSTAAGSASTSVGQTSSSSSSEQRGNPTDSPGVSSSPPRKDGRGDVRPKSFLREEMDEFDRIFSELLFSPGKKLGGCLEAQEEEEEEGAESTPLPASDTTLTEPIEENLSLEGCDCDCSCYNNTSNNVDSSSENDSMNNPTGDQPNGAKSRDTMSCEKCRRLFNSGGGRLGPGLPDGAVCLFSPQSSSHQHGPSSLSDSGNNPASSTDLDPSGQGQGPQQPQQGAKSTTGAFFMNSDNDKLFQQLLDDLDNITGDTPSVRKRKKARDIFSNWVFSSQDSRSPPDKLPELPQRCRSVEVQGSRRQHDLFSHWRPRSFEYLSEDDADSGYHTGSSTLQSKGTRGGRRPPGEWTLTREELRRGIEQFNNNNHGLIMSLQPDTNTFQGFIRVHMNLIRPINMSLSTRPTSIYDVIGQEEEGDACDDKGDMQITSFYLPKDTTKVIHINSDTTTQEVIKALLNKFNITDNPRKFALYEKMLESDKKATMRRMEEEECPLPLCLCWTSESVDGLDRRKFVLQENDTGEIMWEAFSLPELENFLKILNREEEEYVEQVKSKYRTTKIHIDRRLKEIQAATTTQNGEKRQPVFV